MSSALADHTVELTEGIAALGINPAPELPVRLLAFGELLLKWNRVYNLTAIRDPKEIVTHHLLDSLAVAPWVRRLRSLADIGSGAGLPGIPLALACPDLTVYSIEAVGKKASFQQQAKIELRLNNLTIINRRAEAIRAADFPGGGVEGAISRAFSNLTDFARLAGHWVEDGGALYAMKGALPQAQTEAAALPAGWQLEATHPLTVPGLDAERHLLVLRRPHTQQHF
ncbi:MAG: 16S rRNA (guanine(527)-N(7))-methyltransferase RsmG [Azoarcus sp.]|jgi:16S rRNA (guanine527-N7)-methyltransferase|nr:16S rRNA (guanine(527)-N(7))-methyltransferase RsmG [Azoarcus sp.]